MSTLSTEIILLKATVIRRIFRFNSENEMGSMIRNGTKILMAFSIILFLFACNDNPKGTDATDKRISESGTDIDAEYQFNNDENSYVLIQYKADEKNASEMTEEERTARRNKVYLEVKKIKEINSTLEYEGLKVSSIQYDSDGGYSTLIAIRGFKALKLAVEHSELFIEEMDGAFKNDVRYVVPISYSDYRKSMDLRAIDGYFEYYTNNK